jgi:hypothetical protein
MRRDGDLEGSDLLKRDKRIFFFLCVSDLSTQSTRIQRRYGRAATRKKKDQTTKLERCRHSVPNKEKEKDKKIKTPSSRKNLAHQRQRGK